MLFGQQTLGKNVLGTLATKNKLVVDWFDFEFSLPHLDGPNFRYENLAYDFELTFSIPQIFPSIDQGGYIFVTVDDAGTTYNLSFEGIETE